MGEGVCQMRARGGGVKNAKLLRTSFMDGPLYKAIFNFVYDNNMRLVSDKMYQ